MKNGISNKNAFIAIAMLATMLYGDAAFAQYYGGGMPWESTLCTVFKSLSGNTARAVAGIIIVITGLMLAAGEASGWFKTLLGIVCGLSIAFGAVSLLGLIPGAGGGAC